MNYIKNMDAMAGLKTLDTESINCVVTSPPYWNLRSYGNLEGEFGCEETPEEYVTKLCDYFDEVHRVLKNDGVVYVNLGDTYIGSGKGVQKGRSEAKKESFQFSQKPKEKLGGWRKPKQLALVPFRFAIEMQNRGWLLRNNIVWYKKNAIPQSVKDRFVVDYENIFMFTKNKKYFFNQLIEPFATASNKDEIYTGKAQKNYEKSRAQNPSETKRRILESMRARGGRSMRSVWEINTKPNKSVHTATFPEELAKRMIESGCPRGGIVLDFFVGSGTVPDIAKKMGMNYIAFDLNPEYVEISNEKVNKL